MPADSSEHAHAATMHTERPWHIKMLQLAVQLLYMHGCVYSSGHDCCCVHTKQCVRA